MELRAFLFQRCLHCLTRRFGQQRWQTVTKRIHSFHLKPTINQIIGVFAADQSTSDDAHLLYTILGNGDAKIRVVQQVIDGIDELQPIALNRGTDHLGPHGQNQCSVMNYSLGITHLDQLMLGIKFVHLGHSPNAGFELACHATRIQLGQIISRVVFGITRGQHRLGIGAAVVRRNNDKRRFVIMLAKLLGQAVSCQACPENNHRRMDFIHRRFLMVGHIVNQCLF